MLHKDVSEHTGPSTVMFEMVHWCPRS